MKYRSLIVLLFLGYFLSGQTYLSGGDNSGMGKSSAAFDNFWCNSNNQAGMAYYNHTSVGISYQSIFGVRQLSQKIIAATLPTRAGVFGISYLHYGYDKMNEQLIGLAYAKQLGKKISVGIKMDYLQTHIADIYGNRGELIIEIGFMAKLNENFMLGAHVFNPKSILMDVRDKKIKAMELKIGALYSFSPEIKASIDIIKNQNYKPQVNGGIEYHYRSLVKFRTGYATQTILAGIDSYGHQGEFYFGIGFNIKNITFDLASGIHQTLGWSPFISMVYTFNKKTLQENKD